MAHGVGVKVAGVDRQIGGINTIKGIGDVDHRGEPGSLGQVKQSPVLGRFHDPANPGDQNPEARYASGQAVGGDGPVNSRKEFPAIRPHAPRIVGTVAPGRAPDRLRMSP